MDTLNSLDLLLESAVHQHKVYSDGKVRTVKNAQPAEKRPNISTYERPENWTPTRVVTLIHTPREYTPDEWHPDLTLLGNFQEYIHKNGARKLVRIEEPAVANDQEYVTGDWWLTPKTFREHEGEAVHWTTTAQFTGCALMLAQLMLYCPDASVTVTYHFGHIAKVELDTETKFFSADHLTFLLLHRGTDILECLDRDSKSQFKQGDGQ